MSLPEFLLAERQPALVHVDVGLGLQPARQAPPGGVRGAADEVPEEDPLLGGVPLPWSGRLHHGEWCQR